MNIKCYIYNTNCKHNTEFMMKNTNLKHLQNTPYTCSPALFWFGSKSPKPCFLHCTYPDCQGKNMYVMLLHIYIRKNQAQTPKEPHQKHSEEPTDFTPPNLQNHVHIISALPPIFQASLQTCSVANVLEVRKKYICNTVTYKWDKKIQPHTSTKSYHKHARQTLKWP